ncbi:MAG: hypothetical protein Q4D29_04575 [Lachnospiraceae bacterium]|nr:hypothetical protein [Lachnospiraceae bacterium]
MMNRICKTNIIKRTLLAVMAAVTLFTSAVLPSQSVYASYQGGGSDAVSRAESWVGTAEGQAVIDLILSATSDHAITVDCCVRLQKFYIIKLDRKGSFEYLILQAYIKEVITQDEYIAAKEYYMKIK